MTASRLALDWSFAMRSALFELGLLAVGFAACRCGVPRESTGSSAVSSSLAKSGPPSDVTTPVTLTRIESRAVDEKVVFERWIVSNGGPREVEILAANWGMSAAARLQVNGVWIRPRTIAGGDALDWRTLGLGEDVTVDALVTWKPDGRATALRMAVFVRDPGDPGDGEDVWSAEVPLTGAGD
jgi:hypothetical protein